MGPEVVIDLDFLGTAIIVLYLVGLVAIGAVASRKIKTSEDFLVAGRNLGFWTFTLLVVASICSGGCDPMRSDETRPGEHCRAASRPCYGLLQRRDFGR